MNVALLATGSRRSGGNPWAGAPGVCSAHAPFWKVPATWSEAEGGRGGGVRKLVPPSPQYSLENISVRLLDVS